MSIDDRSQEKFGFDEDAARPIPTDDPHSFTVLRAHQNKLLTKSYNTQDRQWRSYNKAYLFSATPIEIRSLDDLHRELTQLAHQPHCCLVAGAVIDGADRSRMRRLSHDHKNNRTGEIDRATLRDTPRHLLAMDVDKIPCPDGIDPRDLKVVAAHVRSRLPRAFHDAGCICMATSGQCIKPDLRVRMFFMLARPLTIAEAKIWLSREHAPVDRSIYTPGGVIYTATAIFDDRSADPFPGGRIVRLDGETYVTPPTADEFAAMTTKKKSSSRKFDHASESPNEVLQRVTEALGYIPSDDYDVWLKVGMALQWADENGEFGENSNAGYELWDEWSQTCDDKYDPAEIDAKWDSFDADRCGAHGPITLVSIFKLARDNGWRPKIDDDDISIGCPAEVVEIVRRAIEKKGDDYECDNAIMVALGQLKSQTEKFAKESREYRAIKKCAIALFARLSRDMRGDTSLKKNFKYDWGIDHTTFTNLLKEHDEKRQRREEATRRQDRSGDEKDQQVRELNRDYCFVIEGGRARVLHEQYNPALKRSFYASLSPKDFEYAFDNRRVVIATPNGLSEIGLGAFWLRHPERRQYLGGVVFDPANRHNSDQLNLWNGFGVKPKKGSWKKFRKHLFRIVCCRNKEWFKYLMRWLANAVQHPERQGEVVVVMRGGEGVGKGFLGRTMTHLFGRHGLHIENPKHLTGSFNAHLHDCAMLFADEAFYAGDKQHVGILKGLVTEPTLTIEKKGKDVFQSGNFIHLIMASNNEWVVPASLDARRFFVLDVRDDRRGDAEYFADIEQELQNGGYEAMLHDLQRMNLLGFNVREFPKTTALQDQKILSMKIEQRWLYDVLCQGYVRKSDHGLEELDQWHEVVTTNFLHDAYTRYASRCGERKPLDQVRFGQFLHSMGWSEKDKTQTGAALAGETRRGSDDPQVVYNKRRRPAYKLGTLDAARVRVATAMGLDLHWPNEGIVHEEAASEIVGELPM